MKNPRGKKSVALATHREKGRVNVFETECIRIKMQFTLYAQNAKWISDNKTYKHILSPSYHAECLFFFVLKSFRLYFSMPSLDGNKIVGIIWIFWGETPQVSPTRNLLCTRSWNIISIDLSDRVVTLNRCDNFKLEFLRAHDRPEHIKQPKRSPLGRRRTKALVRSILEMACRNLLLCNICAREWCEAVIPPLAYMTDCWVCVMLCCVEEKFAIHVESRAERMKFSFWNFSFTKKLKCVFQCEMLFHMQNLSPFASYWARCKLFWDGILCKFPGPL